MFSSINRSAAMDQSVQIKNGAKLTMRARSVIDRVTPFCSGLSPHHAEHGVASHRNSDASAAAFNACADIMRFKGDLGLQRQPSGLKRGGERSLKTVWPPKALLTTSNYDSLP